MVRAHARAGIFSRGATIGGIDAMQELALVEQ